MYVDRSRVSGSRRSPHHLTPSLLATREHTRRAVLRCWLEDDRRCSDAAFCTVLRAPIAGITLRMSGRSDQA